LVCDAGTDEIVRHAISGPLIDPEPDTVIKTDGGSLPRHLAFSPDGARFFVVHELGCSVKSFSYGTNGIRLLAKASTLPDGWTGDSNCATIRCHPNGKFVYASNRGHDSIVVFDVSDPSGALRPLSWHSTRGETPRDFNIDPTGRFLIAANQDGHSLTAFSIDTETGALMPLGEPYAIGSPVCVLFL
jgi:6-phosphogluconolactonase